MNNNYKNVQIKIKYQILSYLFLKNRDNPNGFVNMINNPNLKYAIDHKITKIMKGYDLYIQFDILKYKKKIKSIEKKSKLNFKLYLHSDEKCGFDLDAKYLVNLTIKMSISQEYFKKIQQEHIGINITITNKRQT